MDRDEPADADQPTTDTPPPNGWEAPASDHRRRARDVDALAQILAGLLTAIPDELQNAIIDAARALVEMMQAILNWLASVLQRTGRNSADGGSGPQVHDIPIL
ncbi:MAG: hypothetical protein ACP5H2_10035 [Solirubrobacteraceae bacterium]